jgi:hypothetical protein
MHGFVVIKCVISLLGEVYELVRHNNVTGLIILTQRAYCAGGYDLTYTK